VIFGAGFALTGTCPGGAIAMIATGGLGGLGGGSLASVLLISLSDLDRLSCHS
jgi:hypothetical protein